MIHLSLCVDGNGSRLPVLLTRLDAESSTQTADMHRVKTWPQAALRSAAVPVLSLVLVSAAAAQTVTAVPARAAQGDLVTLHVAAFQMNSLLRIELDGGRVSSMSDYTDRFGALEKQITVPKALPDGSYQIVVTDGYNHRAVTTVTIGGKALEPILTIAPDAGIAGVTVTIQGTNWENRKRSASLRDAAGRAWILAVNDCFTSDSCQPGRLHLVSEVPVGATPGPARLTVSDGLVQASVTFTVTTPIDPNPGAGPAIVLQPISGPPGTWITINGVAFQKGVQVVLKWDTEIKPIKQLVMRTDAQGSFTGLLFQVPAEANAGPHTVTILDGGLHATVGATLRDSASATFSVEAGTTPANPPPPAPPTPPPPSSQPDRCQGIPSYAQPPECKQRAAPLPPGANPRPGPQPDSCRGIPSYAQPPECKQGAAPLPPDANPRPQPGKPAAPATPQAPEGCANIPSYAQPPECKGKAQAQRDAQGRGERR